MTVLSHSRPARRRWQDVRASLPQGGVRQRQVPPGQFGKVVPGDPVGQQHRVGELLGVPSGRHDARAWCASDCALVAHTPPSQGLGRTPKTGSRPGPRPDPHSAPQLERGTSSARAGGQWTWCHGGGVWAPSRPPKRSRWRFSVTNGTLNFRISTVKSHVDSRRSGAMMVADEGRDSALIRAWFNLRHKLATAPSRHH